LKLVLKYNLTNRSILTNNHYDDSVASFTLLYITATNNFNNLCNRWTNLSYTRSLGLNHMIPVSIINLR
jgi:hypothetical protein